MSEQEMSRGGGGGGSADQSARPQVEVQCIVGTHVKGQAADGMQATREPSGHSHSPATASGAVAAAIAVSCEAPTARAAAPAPPSPAQPAAEAADPAVRFSAQQAVAISELAGPAAVSALFKKCQKQCWVVEFVTRTAGQG